MDESDETVKNALNLLRDEAPRCDVAVQEDQLQPRNKTTARNVQIEKQMRELCV